MANVAPSDHALAQAILSCAPAHNSDALIPQSLIDLMPSANEYLARLHSLARDFMPPNPELTCTTMKWWLDRAVAHLCTRDVHPASTTIQ